jgi:mono/diheme cytochrome c family protein
MRRLLLCVTIMAGLWPWRDGAAAETSVERGAYLFAAGGCLGCHTAKDGTPLAGGRALKTPFGTFYGPNITPDREHGIGAWSDEDFIRAMREGVDPEGDDLFPVFPYPSFTNITDQDLLDLKAYIFSLPASAEPSREHEVDFPFGWRFLMTPWKWLNFAEGPFEPDPQQTPEWNRGAYLTTALGHCGECHSPRGWLGEVDSAEPLSGNTEGPEGDKVPNITPDPDTGIGGWSTGQIVTALRSGLLPDGDVVGGAMAEVVKESTSKLTDEDREAIAVYLMSLEPVRNEEAKATKAEY